ncbi:hypothetical protein HRG84_11020 [Flavisolibacter sp. BT320]|nr:hypothetical protein [Flavisolibacter longurius]
MEANSTDNKTFQLTDNGQLLGELVYENIFHMKAAIRLANSDTYAIKPVGLFGTSLMVSKEGEEIADLKMNWRGQIIISFQNGQEFVFKAKGMFHNHYLIENKEGEKLVQYDPKFNWKKFHYNYVLTYDKTPSDSLLLLLGVYAANYFIASMSGATSGT